MSERDPELVHAGQQAKAEKTQTEVAFEKLKAEIVAQWLAAKSLEERERLHAKVSVLAEVQQTLTSTIAQGTAAAKRLGKAQG